MSGENILAGSASEEAGSVTHVGASGSATGTAGGSSGDHGGNQGDNDPPPEWNGSGSYKDYKKRVTLWTMTTKTPASKQGARVFRRLSGGAWDAVESLEPEDVSVEDGVQVIVDELDKRFQVVLPSLG